MLALAVLSAGSVQAQDQPQPVRVRAGFVQDSIRVGEVLQYYLAADYADTLDVLFPDTAFVFTPFEYRRSHYTPTRTTARRSYDSVVYELATFNVDSVQRLALPVYVMRGRDSIPYLAPADSLYLRHVVKHLPDSINNDLPVMATVAYQPVPMEFNYPMVLVMAMVLLVTAAVLWFVFGKSIRRYLRINRMMKAHAQFMALYTEQVGRLQMVFTPEATEGILLLWKRYMEKLTRRPYTRLTSRETLEAEHDNVMAAHLRRVDGAIYGHNTEVVEAFEGLKTIAEQRFTQKLEEVKHG